MSNNLYEFKYKDMEFSKDGQLDELIALDRYVVSTFDGYEIGDVVVAIVDKDMGTKKIATIDKIENDTYYVTDRFGEKHTVQKELLQKPLETKPYQLWERWAKAGASVEKTAELQRNWENEFRWLMDGYRYSLGGRIQLMLGQEYVTGEKANLTAYNCYVVDSPSNKETPIGQFLEVMRIAFYEASIMRRGGGVGLNISNIHTASGSGKNKKFFKFYLPKNHKDYQESIDRSKIGKFDSVNIIYEQQDISADLKEKYIYVKDSVEGHFEAINGMISAAYDNYDSVLIDFSDIRHRNAIVKGVNGRSSGAVSWMELFALVATLLQRETIDNVEFAEIFSFIVHLIIQGGSRRGALMLVCNDDNVNVRKFIERKKEKDDLGKGKWLTGANISVGISDKFMEKVKYSKEWLKTHNYSPDEEADKANELWSLIIESAWKSAEPGVIWMERYNKESNSWYFHPIIATNPCGEQGLPAWGVCNLGHYVLSTFYDEVNNDVNWDDLKRAVVASVRLQDNIIDYTPYFLDENKETQLKERRVGIGSLGLGTLLIKLGLRYGSEEANEFIDKLYKFIAYHQYSTSMDIAIEKGSFPAYDYNKHIQSGFVQKLLSEFPELNDKLKQSGIRNVTISTQAPTGSTGTYIDNIPMFRKLFGGTTTGIEPYFSWEYWRAGRLGVTKQTVDLAKDYMDAHGLTDVEQLPDFFVTAMSLAPSDHVKVQAAVQKWTDSSISKTANCPSDYTIEQTDELYMLSYDLGLKGMTIYRDGSRDAQVLATKEEDAKLESHIEAQKIKELRQVEEVAVQQIVDKTSFIVKRPKRLYGFTEKINFTYGDNLGKAYVTINLNDGEPWEVFISTKVKEVSAIAKALGLMTTKLLRLGCTSDNLQQAIDTLTYDQTMGNLATQLANILKELQKNKVQIEMSKSPKSEMKLAKCSSCGEEAYDKGNCICHSCGVSKCN